MQRHSERATLPTTPFHARRKLDAEFNEINESTVADYFTNEWRGHLKKVQANRKSSEIISGILGL